MKINRNTFVFFIALIFSLLMHSCTETYMGLEQVKTDSTNPGKITVNNVIPKPGALEIHFTLPKGDVDIAQVIATYTSQRGEEREFKVSRYTSSILVEGFVETDKVTVELVTVDNSGNKSEITYVEDTPLESAVMTAFKSLKVTSAFGGLKVDWVNTEGDFLAIHVLTEDMVQKDVITLEEDQTQLIYSRDSLNTYSYLRPYPNEPQRFGFIVSDKWGNVSDTLIETLTPYKEERVDYKHVKAVNWFNFHYNRGGLDYDKYGVSSSTGLQNDGIYIYESMGAQTIFNGQRAGKYYYLYKYIKNLDDGDMSTDELVHTTYSTYDLNVDVRLSRAHLFPRETSGYYYKISSLKKFRIWGTDDSNKDRMTKFPEGWTLIGEYHGRDAEDNDNPTQEEIEWFLHNQEYSIAEDNVHPDANPTKSIRYLRLELLESYGKNSVNYTLNELELYGQIENEYYY